MLKCNLILLEKKKTYWNTDKPPIQTNCPYCPYSNIQVKFQATKSLVHVRVAS